MQCSTNFPDYPPVGAIQQEQEQEQEQEQAYRMFSRLAHNRGVSEATAAAQVIELSEEDRRALARRHPALRSGGQTWLVNGSTAQNVRALLDAVAALGSQMRGSDSGVDLVVRVGGRELVMQFKSDAAGDTLLDGIETERVARELDLAERLQTDPRQLAMARKTVDRAWDALGERWNVWTDYQVANRLGFDGPRPAEFLGPLVRDHVVFGVRRRGTRYFPGFEFSDDFKPRPLLRDVLMELPPRWTNLDKALWFDAPNGWLDGGRPAELLLREDSKPLLKAARSVVVPAA